MREQAFAVRLGAVLLSSAAASASLAPRPALAQDSVPHKEACTVWNYEQGRLGTVNRCREPVDVRFMVAEDPRVQERRLAPGERFDTGLEKAQINSWWMFTTCPPGFVSDIPFEAPHSAAIIDSRYVCVQRPTH